MSVAEFLNSQHETAFSFEVLPPVKGHSIEQIYKTIDRLRQFNPAYINITTHRSDYIYREKEPGIYIRQEERHRPGTVAIAAAIKNKYNIPTVPHLICSGFTAQETEYELIDLSFLGIMDLILLRGDKSKEDARFTPMPGGLSHASELCSLVNNFNAGNLLDGKKHEMINDVPFTYGVAGYPEKHEEAMNLQTDLDALKDKVAQGAGYVVTQMFFDNEKYFSFVDRLRAEGITVPIIPGIKPIVFKNQLTVLPKIFRSEIPEPFAAELRKCKDDEEAKEVGIEWSIQQCKELMAHGVPSLHFYTMMASDSVRRIAQAIY